MQEGRSLFNDGKFWEAHEAWEQVWRRHEEPWRYFVQGLIQAAAAHHQLRRGIRHGAIKHLKNALAKLDSAPAELGGLDLEDFRLKLRHLEVELERARVSEFDRLRRAGFARLNNRGVPEKRGPAPPPVDV